MRDRIKFPTTWREAFGNRRVFQECHDNVALNRSFGYPEGIEPEDIIWLELALSRNAYVELNTSWIGTFVAGTTRIDVTSELQARNELTLNVDGPTADDLDTTILEAALLIESSNPR